MTVKSTNSHTNRTVVILLRSSGSDPAEAFARDERLLRKRLAEASIDHRNALVLHDCGSGGSRNRPGLEKVRKLLGANEISAIACVDVSRIVRAGRLTSLLYAFIERDVKIVQADGPLSQKSIRLLQFAIDAAEALRTASGSCRKAVNTFSASE